MDEIETFLSTKCIGKKNAVKSSVLESMFQLKGSEVRKIINRIRCRSGATDNLFAAEAPVTITLQQKQTYEKQSEISMAELPRSMQQRTDCKTR